MKKFKGGKKKNEKVLGRRPNVKNWNVKGAKSKLKNNDMLKNGKN